MREKISVEAYAREATWACQVLINKTARSHARGAGKVLKSRECWSDDDEW